MFDAVGLSELHADLTGAPFKVRAAARGVVEMGAANIKRDAAQFASGLSHAPLYPRSISYDVTEAGIGEVEAEIGPDKGRPQGALGNLLEYGSANNAPHAHMGPALDREGPRFTKAMLEAAGRVL